MRVHWLARRRGLRTDGRELLGFTYSNKALRQIRALRIDARQAMADARTKWLFTRGTHAELPRDAHRVMTIDFDCGWTDADATDDALADVGITSALMHLLRSDWHE
jgi:hypothetical protein